MKTKFSMFVVLCLLVTLFTGCLTGFAADMPVVEQMYSYDDVKEGHWSYPWVTYMTNHNYIHGYPADENDGLYLYKPDQFITRGEFVTILYFMLKPQGHMTETFTDFTTKHWSYPYVDKAVANGYLSGYGDGTVRADAFITREEASSVVYRAFKIDKYTEETQFVDSSNISGWAYEAIMSLAQLGVIVGYTGEEENTAYVQPKVNIKRAEVAALLANADKFYPASVQFGDKTLTFEAAKGGKLEFDMFPKNTSDNLSIALDVEPDKTYTVTYVKDGVEKTVSADEFAKEVFTAQELENLEITLNFPDAKAGDKAQVKVTVTDKKDAEDGEDDAVVGERVYDIEFTGQGGVVTNPIMGGGGISVFTVTYKVNGTIHSTEPVQNGNKPVSVPRPNNTEDYVWTYEDGTPVIPGDEPITSNCTFITTGTKVRRDRVVESLKAYQAMKGKGTGVATVSALTGDTVNNTITPNATDGTDWWTNDMLQVIVTNDRGYNENDTAQGKNDLTIDDGTGLDEVLKPIYDDVARYVVDNDTYFTTATTATPITSATKLEYVAYFRAMVATIESAADVAVSAYVNARKNNADADPNNNQYKNEAFDAFKLAAAIATPSALSNALDNEFTAMSISIDNARKDALSNEAVAYVTAMVEKLAPAGTADGAKLNAGLAAIKTILEGIYGPTFDFNDATACTNAANAVKAQIAQQYIYAK